MAEIQKGILHARLGVDQNVSTKGNDYPHDDNDQFSFSLDKNFITYVKDVFDEYGEQPDMYWGLQIFDIKTKKEKTLFVDDDHFAYYEWLNDDTIRVFQDGGTGVRMYRDIKIHEEKPIFYRNYKYKEPPAFWRMDDDYAKTNRDAQDARTLYYSLQRSK